MSWWRRVFRRRPLEDRLDAELRHHIELQIQDHMRDGMTEEEARRKVALEFGGLDVAKEECRDTRKAHWLEALAQDYRYAIRALRKSPGFTAVAILSLTLGIGANTAVFQLVNAVRLKSLPIAHPEELVEIQIDGGNRGLGSNRGWNSLTYPLWEKIRDHQQAFSAAFAWSPAELEIGKEGDLRAVRGVWVSGDAFRGLGIAAARGRLLGPADDEPGCAGNVVISHGFWQREFAGRDEALGSRIEVDGHALAIVGVTPQDFFGIEVGRSFDVALPFCTYGFLSPFELKARSRFWLGAMGRLKPGWTVERAASHLQGASAAWFQAVVPGGYDAASISIWDRLRLTATPRPRGISELRKNYEISLWLLLGITGLVLLIACANLANLVLARTVARKQEIATRLALGASRGKVISQFLAEAILLSAVGTLAGWATAGALSRGLTRFLSTQGDIVELDLSSDWRVTAFLFTSAMLTCLFLGLSSALYATRNRALTLNTESRSFSVNRQTVTIQRLLIGGQIAISLVLVASSLLLIRSFHNLLTVDAGFNQNGLTFSYLNLQATRTSVESMPELKRNLLSSIRSIPGIESAATSTHLPLSGGGWSLMVREAATGRPGNPAFIWISPGYFETMEIPLRAGRDFSERDSAKSPYVLIVNERFAREYVGGANPIGQTVRSLAEPGYPEATYEIVGIVADTRYNNLREEPPPIAYAPAQQNPDTRPIMAVVTRSSLPGATLTKSITSATQGISRGVVIAGTVDLRAQVVGRLSRERMLAWLAGFFGVLAAGLVATGLYGVVSYIVSSRRREIGIRMALGANARSVLWMVLGQTAMLAVAGCSVGILAGLAVTRVTRGLLFGIEPSDPVTFGGSALLLLVVALSAAYLPGHSASRTNPIETLRSD